jgi:Flp pilus assembly pilin Flp
MWTCCRALIRFLVDDDDEGTTSVEYAVMLALIILTCIGGARAMSDASMEVWNRNIDELESVEFITP